MGLLRLLMKQKYEKHLNSISHIISYTQCIGIIILLLFNYAIIFLVAIHQ